ncbi:alpha-N-acetylglucosaminidase TIM-barrel domain-containing protein [Novosphingobium resinovorum]
MDTGEVASPFALRAYLNTCTYGYTTPWWGWDRWEQEIDWMAAHGVDTPLAMEGQEYVWRELWRESGLSETAIAEGLSAAPFLPWQRMGNLAGYRAPLSSGWIEKKHQLQLRILARMRALGMKPVLPAFAGYVPEAFAKAHPRARIYKMRAWGFPPTYWLDPSDPLFTQLAARFVTLYNRTYGEGEYYLADAFNEMIPRSPRTAATPLPPSTGTPSPTPPPPARRHCRPQCAMRALLRMASGFTARSPPPRPRPHG